MSAESQPDITTLTVQLLRAFVSHNPVPSDSLAALIRSTRLALTADLDPDKQAETHGAFLSAETSPEAVDGPVNRGSSSMSASALNVLASNEAAGVPGRVAMASAVHDEPQSSAQGAASSTDISNGAPARRATAKIMRADAGDTAEDEISTVELKAPKPALTPSTPKAKRSGKAPVPRKPAKDLGKAKQVPLNMAGGLDMFLPDEMIAQQKLPRHEDKPLAKGGNQDSKTKRTAKPRSASPAFATPPSSASTGRQIKADRKTGSVTATSGLPDAEKAKKPFARRKLGIALQKS